jgi:hypothetical protein
MGWGGDDGPQEIAVNPDVNLETTRTAIRITAEQLARSIDLLRSESGSLARDRLEILEQRMWAHQARLQRMLADV